MKPVRLMAYLVANSSGPGEVVLDPFVGSGTTLVACEQLGRTCWAMELVPADLAQAREAAPATASRAATPSPAPAAGR